MEWLEGEAKIKVLDEIIAELNKEVPATTGYSTSENRLGMSNTLSNKRILNLAKMEDVAREFLLACYTKDSILTLRSVKNGSSCWAWNGSFYASVDAAHVARSVSQFVNSSFREYKGEVIPLHANIRLEKDILHYVWQITNIGCETSVSGHSFWVHENNRLAHEVIPCLDGLFYFEEFCQGKAFQDCIKPHNPALFCRSVVPISLSEANKQNRPTNFLTFLNQIFSEDDLSIKLLQEWMGYCLTTKTHMHKILLMVGVPRSGKSTIVRVIAALVGPGNFTPSSFLEIMQPKGMELWEEAKVVAIPESRVGTKIDKARMAEVLLKVSGEDDISIGRMWKKAIRTVLCCKIMIVSNEMPEISEASGALHKRLLFLHFQKSFFGREDVTLYQNKILPELSSIFAWALQGLKRLLDTGEFTPIPHFQETLDSFQESIDPLSEFVKYHCKDSKEWVPRDVIFNAYVTWCEEEGHTAMRRPTFWKSMLAKIPTLKQGRPRKRGESSVRQIHGITLSDR